MKLLEIKTLLNKFGFDRLSLVKADEQTKTYTFKFQNYDISRLTVKPTMAAGGKVLVFNIPDVGKIGLSAENQIVRFIDSGTRDNAPKASDKHLGFVDVPAELSLEFQKAAINSAKRVQYLKNLWTHLNTTKFGSQMKMPHLECSSSPSKGKGSHKTARGIYFGGPSFQPGTLWIADFMFNAREPFFLEVFAHEMCHEATWTISKDRSSAEQGHGPTWQNWMKHVGLDPRRFDPTDDLEYRASGQGLDKEEEYTKKYGPRASPSYLKSLVPLKNFVEGPVIYLYNGRAIKGSIRQLDIRIMFYFQTLNGESRHFIWKNKAEFMKTGLPNMYVPKE
jgi:hypothetical protein